MKSHKNKLFYTLGLDIGIASVGAALLGKDRIIGLHVRTFDKAETAKEGKSLNKIRRDSRLTRRRIRRRAHRMVRLLRLMKREGIIKKANVEVIIQDAQFVLDPWKLRSEGLDRKLQDIEWAAVIYHIIKHRGFHSNRKSESKSDKKVGQMLSGVKRNKSLLLEKNYRTVGELVNEDEYFKNAKRNKRGGYLNTFSRDDLLHELNLLFNQQRNYQNLFASEIFENEVVKILMSRKPVLSGDALIDMIGYCSLEPTEKRAPKASYYAERFVWLSKLNNLKISKSGEQRSLTNIERDQLVNLPFQSSKLTYKQIRKKLDLSDDESFNGLRYLFADEIKKPEDSVFFEAKYFHALRKSYENAGLQSKWAQDVLNHEKLSVISYALTCFKDDDGSRQWLKNQKIEDDVIDAVLEISFDQFVSNSIVAIKKILPHMENGLRYDEAIAAISGYNLHQNFRANKKSKYLPKFDAGEIRNPVVYRALNQARKLVNAIVRQYGAPASIHIELARDLSKPKSERDEIKKGQDEFKREKAQVEELFKEYFQCPPNGSDIKKLQLYKEQDGKCAYSQCAIDLHRLCEVGYVEVDHILPYSRSFDDGRNNQVLVLTKENRDKRNRTPYEYLGGELDSERWKIFSAWVMANKKFKKAKRDRLLRKNFISEDAFGFRERNLSDTRYICRKFKNHIEKHLEFSSSDFKSENKSTISSDFNDRCVVVSGMLTSYLRAHWGLVKVRSNGDLHHALDAATVAAANRSMVKRLSDYSRKKELYYLNESNQEEYVDPETGEIINTDALERLRKIDSDFPKPWAHFREELLALLSPNPRERLSSIGSYSVEDIENVKPIRVSRMANRRGLGSAHQDTIRSVGRNGNFLKDGISVIKKPLSDLRLKDLENIVGYEDPRNFVLIEAIRKRLEEYAGDGKKAFSEDKPIYKPSSSINNSPQIRSVKLKEKQNSGISVRNGVANNGDMLRVDIFIRSGKFYAVPLYVSDSVTKALPNRAATAGKKKNDWAVIDDAYSFLFSLYKNDWVVVKLKEATREGYFGGLDISTAAISLWSHDRNPSVGKNGEIRSIGIKTAISIEKYHVDLLGRLHKINNEERQPLTFNQMINAESTI